VGVAGSWSNDDIDFDTLGDSAELDSWQAGAYGSYGFGRFYADALVSYASHDVDVNRLIDIVIGDPPYGPLTAQSSYNATTWTVDGEVGMIWRLGRVNVQPSAGLAWTSLDVDGFSETGTADEFLLIVGGADEDSLASTLAIRASGTWMMGKTQVVPEIRVGWRHEFESDPMAFTAAFDELNSPIFTIISSDIQEDAAVVRAGLTAGVTRNLEVFLNVNGQYGSDASATNASGGLRVTW
jgi:outer membrane autotransporter protein